MRRCMKKTASAIRAPLEQRDTGLVTAREPVAQSREEGRAGNGSGRVINRVPTILKPPARLAQELALLARV